MSKFVLNLCDATAAVMAATIASQTVLGKVQDGSFELVDEIGRTIQVGQKLFDLKCRTAVIVGGFAPNISGEGRVIVARGDETFAVKASDLNLFWVEQEEMEMA